MIHNIEGERESDTGPERDGGVARVCWSKILIKTHLKKNGFPSPRTEDVRVRESEMAAEATRPQIDNIACF